MVARVLVLLALAVGGCAAAEYHSQGAVDAAVIMQGMDARARQEQLENFAKSLRPPATVRMRSPDGS